MTSSMSSSRWWRRVEAGNGVLLREIDPRDAAGVLAVHGDPRVYVHDPEETHPDVAHSTRFVAPMIEHWERHGFGYWTVLVPAQDWPEGVAGHRPDDGRRVIAGLGGIQHHTVDGGDVLNVYFRLAHSLHGRGLGGRVLDLSIAAAALVGPGLDLVVRTRPANLAARRVAERAGFIDLGLEPGTTDMHLLHKATPETVAEAVADSENGAGWYPSRDPRNASARPGCRATASAGPRPVR